MKAYIHPNIDGRRQAMVAARTLVEAARKMNTSAHDMRSMGWRYAKNEDLDLACDNPGWVFSKPVGESGGLWLKWRRPNELVRVG